MVTKFKKLRDDVILPKKATPLSVGYDLYVCEDVVVPEGRTIIPLGFALEMPEGLEAKIEPRSGFSAKGIEGYSVVVSPDVAEEYDTPFEGSWRRFDKSDRFDADVLVGKVDPDYRGEVGVIIKNNDEQFLIAKGTRVAQMTFYKTYSPTIEEIDELTKTMRDGGGFGSTGTN